MCSEKSAEELYTCIGKGGTYRLIGTSKGAGVYKGQTLIVYQDIHTGQLYHRTAVDFAERMAQVRGV